ncbi:MAG: hypothetical protein ACLFO5_08515 [Opitutales bacterium]
MDREEAKNILHLCRPDHASDHEDPRIKEALGFLERDSELRAWFEDQQAFDAAFSEQLNQIEPPEDLRESIIAGMWERASGQADCAAGGSGNEMKHGSRSQAWWRNPWVGIAALFAVLFVVSAFVMPHARNAGSGTHVHHGTATAGVPDVLRFLSEEMHQLKELSQLDKTSDDVEELKNHLAETGSPKPEKIPEDVTGKSTIGCISFNYKGSRISLICFEGEKTFHLSTANKDALDENLPQEPKIYEFNNSAFKVWTEGDQVHFLSIKGSKEELSSLI